MKKIWKHTLLTLMILIVFSLGAISCSAVEAVVINEVDTISAVMAEKAKIELVVTGEVVNLRKNKTTRLNAEVRGVDVQPQITWSSSEATVASVDSTGLVKGLAIGRTVITATAVVDGETVQGHYSINVISAKGPIKEIFSNYNIFSYRYDYVDDVYYTDDKNCWQKPFGFARIYDILSPYVAMEYDYTRIFFTYEGKDFMVQFWKGQYGYLFYGGEIGIYSKPASDEKVNMFTFFAVADEEDWPMMELSLYHQQLNGNWKREFTRDYDRYWWCTGFKAGILRDVEPADELRLVSRITFKDENFASLVAQGLRDCGFAEATSKDQVGLDCFHVDGADIYVKWQNISEAENTMGIKIGATALFVLNIFAIFIAAFLMLGGGIFVLGFLFLL